MSMATDRQERAIKAALREQQAEQVRAMGRAFKKLGEEWAAVFSGLQNAFKTGA